jgi:hypothetical protein
MWEFYLIHYSSRCLAFILVFASSLVSSKLEISFIWLWNKKQCAAHHILLTLFAILCTLNIFLLMTYKYDFSEGKNTRISSIIKCELCSVNNEVISFCIDSIIGSLLRFYSKYLKLGSELVFYYKISFGFIFLIKCRFKKNVI